MPLTSDELRLLALLKAEEREEASLAHLDVWCETNGYVPAQHHRLIIAALERLERGDNDRLMVFMPPGSAKSTYGSMLFPPWYMGRNPTHNVMTCSHTMNLAKRFGRRTRNIVQGYGSLLGIGVANDSKAADRWAIEQLYDTMGNEEQGWNERGEYMAAGVDTGIAGFRSDLTVIDDPVKGRKEAESEVVRQGIWDWWVFDVRPRLKPGGKVVLIMCMTGDTPVLMANGTERPLSDIRPGDSVASYHNGRLEPAKVLNWVNQGPDDVYEIRMKSGITVRANERHPFLVRRNGGPQWIRLKGIKTGDRIVSIGASGAASNAPSATSLPNAAGSAIPITTRPDGRRAFGPHPSTQPHAERPASSIDTGSRIASMRSEWQRRTGVALFAASPRAETSEPIGEASSASTMTTQPEPCGAFSAMTATLPLDTARRPTSLKEPLSTFAVTDDQVAEIVPVGRAEVYDVQIEGTENFIANGLVSHNTRWHEDDLAGRLLAEEPGRWEVLRLPMEADSLDDPLGRRLGDRLWPEWFTPDMVREAKQDPYLWLSLYQQSPSNAMGTYWMNHWFHGVDPQHVPPMNTLTRYGGSDYATKEGEGDYTVHLVVGVDPIGRPWLLDVWRERTASDLWVEVFCDMVTDWKPMAWGEEKGQIMGSLDPFIKRETLRRRAFTVREQFASTANKSIMGQSMRGYIANNGLWYDRTAPWAKDFINELMAFPTGKYDDQHDALSKVGMLLAKIQPGKAPKAPDPRRQSGYKPTTTVASGPSVKTM